MELWPKRRCFFWIPIPIHRWTWAPNLMSDVAQHRHPRLHRDSGSVAAERNFCFSIWAELTKCIVEMTRAVLGVTFVAQFDLRS